MNAPRASLLLLLLSTGSFAQTVIPPILPQHTQAVASTASAPAPVVQPFPGHAGLKIAIWGLSATEYGGNLSEIIVFLQNPHSGAKALWRSEIEEAYAPTIEFVPAIASEGLPIALVYQQFGAAWGELELVGRSGGRIRRIQRLMCSFYEVKQLNADRQDFIIGHDNIDILDVPHIYRWSGRRLMDVSAAHQSFYRVLLQQDEQEAYEAWSGIALHALAQIAALAGNARQEVAILKIARKNEQTRGADADPALLRSIARRLRTLESAHIEQ